MSQDRIITGAEFGEVWHDFDHTAFRLELQHSYLETEEAELFAAFMRGVPEPPTAVPELREWYDRIAAHTREGKRVERVRVQQDPPTDYQRFERWLDRWNVQAGETMRYLTRRRADEIGLLPGRITNGTPPADCRRGASLRERAGLFAHVPVTVKGDQRRQE